VHSMRLEDLLIGQLFWDIRDAVIVAEAETGRIVFWNPVAEKLFGYSASEALELGLEVLIPKHLKAQQWARIKRYAEAGRSWHIDSHELLELPALRKDGEEIRVELSLSPMELGDDADGDGPLVLAIVRDITARRQAGEGTRRLNETLERQVTERTAELQAALTQLEQKDKALRESEGRFRSLGQNSSEVTSVFSDDGIVVYQSPSIERVLGYKLEDTIGKSVSESLPVHPNDLSQRENLFAKVRDNPQVQARAEFRLQRADGSWCHIEAVGKNLLHESSIAGIVVNYWDVSERKQTEANLRRSLNTLLALHEAGRILGSTLDHDEIGLKLLRIMHRVANLTAVAILTQDEEGCWHVWQSIGPEPIWDRAWLSSEACFARERALESKEAIRFRLQVGGAERKPGEKRLTGLCVPFRMREHVVGLLEAYRPEDLTDDETIEMLSSLTSQAASALENAQLYKDLSERKQQLHKLVGELLRVQEEERRRVAYEVHDGLAQVAYSAYQHLQAYAKLYPPASQDAMEKLDRGVSLVQQTVKEARSVIAGLRPTALDDLGLGFAIGQEVNRLCGEGWQVEYKQRLGEERLPEAIETALFRVAQEALTNARKHVKTRRLRVELWQDEGAVRLRVRDWGQGFDSSTLGTAAPGERVGIHGMRERIALLGGGFELWSQPGEGTLIFVDLPLPVAATKSRSGG
jgi:PAS domain S-box-containing protein